MWARPALKKIDEKRDSIGAYACLQLHLSILLRKKALTTDIRCMLLA